MQVGLPFIRGCWNRREFLANLRLARTRSQCAAYIATLDVPHTSIAYFLFLCGRGDVARCASLSPPRRVYPSAIWWAAVLESRVEWRPQFAWPRPWRRNGRLWKRRPRAAPGKPGRNEQIIVVFIFFIIVKTVDNDVYWKSNFFWFCKNVCEFFVLEFVVFFLFFKAPALEEWVLTRAETSCGLNSRIVTPVSW